LIQTFSSNYSWQFLLHLWGALPSCGISRLRLWCWWWRDIRWGVQSIPSLFWAFSSHHVKMSLPSAPRQMWWGAAVGVFLSILKQRHFQIIIWSYFRSGRGVAFAVPHAGWDRCCTALWKASDIAF